MTLQRRTMTVSRFKNARFGNRPHEISKFKKTKDFLDEVKYTAS
jgi:hypothetical protein